MPIVPSRWARRRHATHDALQRAALRLVRQCGLEAVTIEAICAEAGVSPRTFFNYFSSKDEAIIDWSPQVDAFVTRAVIDRPATESPLQAIRSVLGAAVADAMRIDPWHDRLQLLREQPGLIGRFATVMSSVQRALATGVAGRTGLPTAHFYVELTAALSVTAIRTAVRAWTDAPPGTDPARLIDEAFGYLASGLLPPQG